MGSTTPLPPSRGESHRSFGTPGSNCSRPGHSFLPSSCAAPRAGPRSSTPVAPCPSSSKRTPWRKGGWRGGLSHHLRCRALFAHFVFPFVQVALCATLQNVQVHRRNKKSASLTLSVDLNSANECQCMCVRRQEEMRLFPPDEQPRPTIQSQINTKEAGTGLLATKARGLELRLLGP